MKSACEDSQGSIASPKAYCNWPLFNVTERETAPMMLRFMNIGNLIKPSYRDWANQFRLHLRAGAEESGAGDGLAALGAAKLKL